MTFDAGLRGELCSERADATAGTNDERGLPGELSERFDDLQRGHAWSRQRRRDGAVEALR